ncbi:MAG TPA: ABC-type transport auxiliary lipoprotein family protein [Myxococcota bacterium]|nr:ABC-type transport auxiliary lipoprotein family protein [Myxococcota bacterium]
MRLAAAFAAAVLAAGCLTAQPPLEPRYFTPVVPRASPPDPTHGGDLLRVRRVRAAAYLRDRMVWRNGVEIGFYDLLRWTESPARFAQAALEDELFDRRGFVRTSSVNAASLKSSLEAFDELLAPAHEAAVALDVVLTNAKGETLIDRTFEARKPISGGDPKDVADALGAALAEVVGQVGTAAAEAAGSHAF